MYIVTKTGFSFNINGGTYVLLSSQISFSFFPLFNIIPMSVFTGIGLSLNLRIGLCSAGSQSYLYIGITCGVWKNTHAWAPNTRKSDVIGME